MNNVLLCMLNGGAGNRLWPISTEETPKQFLDIYDNKSMFLNTVNRHEFINNILIMSSKSSSDSLLSDMRNISYDMLGKKEEKLISYTLEKSKIGTTLCAVISCFMAQKLGLDFVMLSPTDHLIHDHGQYEEDIKDAMAYIANIMSNAPENTQIYSSGIAIFGIKPTNPNNEYGYIKANLVQSDSLYKINTRSDDAHLVAYEVDKFIEKPNFNEIESVIFQDGFWNLGIYILNPKRFLSTFKSIFPQQYQQCSMILQNMPEISPNKASENFSEIVLPQTIYAIDGLKDIDRDITQIAKNVLMFQARFDWSDMGSYKSIWRTLPKDQNNSICILKVDKYKIISPTIANQYQIKNCYINVMVSGDYLYKYVKYDNITNINIDDVYQAFGIRNLYNKIVVINNNEIIIRDF